MSSKNKKASKHSHQKQFHQNATWSNWIDCSEGEDVYQARWRVNDEGEKIWESRWTDTNYDDSDIAAPSSASSYQRSIEHHTENQGNQEHCQRMCSDFTTLSLSDNVDRGSPSQQISSRACTYTPSSKQNSHHLVTTEEGYFQGSHEWPSQQKDFYEAPEEPTSIGYITPSDRAPTAPDTPSLSRSTHEFQVRQVSPKNDEGTLFGRICEELGLLEEEEDYSADSIYYGHSGSNSKSKKSRNLRNNCFFVALGHLLKLNWRSLYDISHSNIPSKSFAGVKLGELEQMLNHLGGLRHVAFPFIQAEELSPTDLRPQQKFALDRLTIWLDYYSRSSFMIGYQRLNKSAHCIVAKRREGCNGYNLVDYKFTCYQTDPKGVDKADDVKKSFIRFAVFRDPDLPTSDMQLDFFYEASAEGVVNHVQLYDNPDHLVANTSHHKDYETPKDTTYSVTSGLHGPSGYQAASTTGPTPGNTSYRQKLDPEPTKTGTKAGKLSHGVRSSRDKKR